MLAHQRTVLDAVAVCVGNSPDPTAERDPAGIALGGDTSGCLGVLAPPAQVAEGLSIKEAGIPVGRLTMAGAPSPAFRQGPRPLAVEIAALRDYTAVDKTAQAANRVWWTDLAVAGVPLPVLWSLRYTTDVTLVVEGSTVTRVIIGSVAATVTLVVDGGTLYVQSITR